MTNRYDRRDILKGVGAIWATSFLPAPKLEAAPQNLQIAGRKVEVQIAPGSAHTFRLSVLPIESGQPQSVKGNGSLVQASWGRPLAKFMSEERERKGRLDGHSVEMERLTAHSGDAFSRGGPYVSASAQEY